MIIGNLAPPGQIGWSGQNWYERPSHTQPSITVIEPPSSESYESYRKRKNREETEGEPRRMPFGFASWPEEGT